MKVSLNWVKKFTDVSLPIDELVEKIGAQLGAVDDVINVGEKYKSAVIAKVVACEKHPNADKLSLCLIDDGRKVKDVNRDSKGLVQVVCGAPNVAAGQLVVWLPPGATVPNSFDKEPFVLEAREIRGKLSNGMIASAKELAIGDDHTGIEVIEDDIKPGTNFAEVFELNDHIIDIENKMFTHRPDCFGMLGIAREIAGISHKAFKSPNWYTESAEAHNDGRKNVLKLEVKNELPKLVLRFSAVAIKDIKVKPSPLWLRTYLSRVGVRPINNVVDLTNYLMLETGQPLHAYDYDKVKIGEDATLGVREARPGEQVTVLGGKTIQLKKGVIVITDGKHPIGLGGVMGGASTEVDEQTKSIILECATFDMNTTRRTAMEYGLFTDAATRFTKNQSPRQNKAVLLRAMDEVRKVAGGRVASKIVDIKALPPVKAVLVESAFINSRLGLNLPATTMKKTLENVEFEVSVSGGLLTIRPPFWRTDIEIAEDVVEEVGRLHGYDSLPHELPLRSIKPAEADERLSLKAKIREFLSAAGANEVLTYSFVPELTLKKVGQDPAQAYHIRNALSPDLQYYRLSLTPSLLEKVHPNIKQGFDEFVLFEMNKSHNRLQKDETEPDLPKEIETLALVVAGRDKSHKASGSAYFEARRYLDYFAEKLGMNLVYQPLAKEPSYPFVTPYDPSRSAIVSDIKSGELLGIIGEYKQNVAQNFKLPIYSAGFELGMDYIQIAASNAGQYRALNRFPSLGQDLCLRTAADLPYQTLTDFITARLQKIVVEHGYEFILEPIDIFQKENDDKYKQTTWHIELQHTERTLTTVEVNEVFDKLASDAKKEFNAERI